MKFRAVIFDIYKTLLEVGPAPADAEERWRNLFLETFGKPSALDLKQFSEACERIIAREHATARAAGIAFPEIFWPLIAGEILPEISTLSTKACDDFLFQHAQLLRTVRLMERAGDVLKELSKAGLLLGIASNSQPYTLRELDTALAVTGLSRSIFNKELCFYSFENGFSKPDPHVFRFLTARLRLRGISPEEILMVGDRSDNDIEPARANGWQTWRIAVAAANAENCGNWHDLQALLRTSLIGR